MLTSIIVRNRCATVKTNVTEKSFIHHGINIPVINKELWTIGIIINNALGENQLNQLTFLPNGLLNLGVRFIID